jgi:pyrimidine operon attenuation protein / uracil phosphoribosyltransferase
MVIPVAARPDNEHHVLDETQIGQLLDELAGNIVDRYRESAEPCLIGIRRRGDILAARLRERIDDRMGPPPPLGRLDITLYRDDFDSLSQNPIIGETDIPFELDGRTVILVDDVLFTGRTIRAALGQILDLGRPARVVLVVLVDRGWRELPIAPDLVGQTLITEPDDEVQVLLNDTDGIEAVILRQAES